MRGEWVDPIPGDWWTAQGFEFRVDMVQNGEVYFVRFDTSEPPETLGCAGRVTLDDWREVMQIGYKGETLAESEKRIERVFELGFMPFSQLYQPPDANVPTKIYGADWKAVNRKWSRPAAYMGGRELVV